MVGVVQWLERQIVALDVVGSNPTTHPIFRGEADNLLYPLPLPHPQLLGCSQAVKAPDFDSGMRRFKSRHPSQLTR